MLLLNLGSRWTLLSRLADVQGTIVLPAANSAVRLVRAHIPNTGRLFFDPQLYLAGLQPDISPRACGRLGAHPWFGVHDIPEFDSSAWNTTDYERIVGEYIAQRWPGHPPEEDDILPACRACLEFQIGLGCTHLLLPTPLIAEREDEASAQALWLDKGLEAASNSEVGQPILASVALSEAVLNEEAFAAGGFLDTIVDQVKSRDGLDGVYFLILQNQAAHPFEMSRLVIRAYLHLARSFSRCSYPYVVSNFGDLVGLMAMGVGASEFCTGPTHSLRRIALSAYVEEGSGGPVVPLFYCHKLGGEIPSEHGLDPIVKAKLLRHVWDNTRYSKSLLSELTAGGSAATVPDWAEAPNNVTASHLHFLLRLAEEAAHLASLSLSERQERILSWLEDAEAWTQYVGKRLSERKETLHGNFAPLNVWREVFTEFVS